MPKLVKALSALEVNRITAAGVHAVGNVAGLLLHVSETGARSWLLRTTVGSKRREIGLGAFPETRLAQAIEKARELKVAIAGGVDPVAEKQAAKQRLKAEQLKMQTFEQCAKAFMASRKAEWRNPKHAAQWGATLEQYAYPIIGSLSVADVDTSHVTAVLEPIWTSKTETAVRLRGRIEMVLNWAKVKKLRTGENPAAWRGHLDQVLAKPSRVAKKGNFASLEYQQTPAFMTRLRQADGMGARALEFAILCASRSGEVRGAKWSEIDLAAGLWTIPGDRMKAGKAHRVALSADAVKLLKSLPRLAGDGPDSDLVFWSSRSGVLSDMTLTAVLKRMGVAVTAHGFRSTFRTWAAERTAFPREVCEAALAHVNGDKVEATYQRSDLFEKRRELMAQWAKFLANPVAVVGGDVVPLPVTDVRVAA